MILTKRTCCISVSLDCIANLPVVGGLSGTHGRTKRVSCLQRIYTDLTSLPSHHPLHLFLSHDLIHLFDLFSWPSSHYPARTCRIAVSCLFIPYRTPFYFRIPLRPIIYTFSDPDPLFIPTVIGIGHHFTPFLRRMRKLVISFTENMIDIAVMCKRKLLPHGCHYLDEREQRSKGGGGYWVHVPGGVDRGSVSGSCGQIRLWS